MGRLAGIFFALVAFAAVVQARAEPSTAESATAAAAGIGEQIKEGAEKAAMAVKNGALDLWEAGKAAVSAGSKELDERRAARDHEESSGSSTAGAKQ